MGSTATILHADLDAFYASVEQLLDPKAQDQVRELVIRAYAEHEQHVAEVAS